MILTRRSFLKSMLALGAAPAIVRADSLMRIVAPKTWRETAFISDCGDELLENISADGGVTRYSYSASFEVMLASRNIQGVQRMWADGVEFQLDKFEIATDERSGLIVARARRLDLTDFGNRIPNLEFEVWKKRT